MNFCPVCGYAGIDFDPKAQDYDICPCCATEFGLSDVEWTHEELRADWIARGKVWWSEYEKPPQDWDADEQLKTVTV